MLAFQAKTLLKQAINQTGTFLLSPPVGGLGQTRNHGPRTVRQIALTFDDGPSEPATSYLLDVMGELGVKGTFFCVGVNAQWHPQIVRRAYDEGHVIGNHSMFHSRKAGFKPGYRAHFEESGAILGQIIGCEPRLYRPPWGWLTPWDGQRLIKRGYTIVGWDVYTLDWQWPEPDGLVVAEEARRVTKPGSILLFHDANAGVKEWDKKQTARAIQSLVPALQADGYEFVTADRVLGVEAYGPSLVTATSLDAARKI